MREVARGDKHYLRETRRSQTTNQLGFLLDPPTDCVLRLPIFSSSAYHLGRPHAQSFFSISNRTSFWFMHSIACRAIGESRNEDCGFFWQWKVNSFLDKCEECAQAKGRRERETKRKGKEKGKLAVKLWSTGRHVKNRKRPSRESNPRPQ